MKVVFEEDDEKSLQEISAMLKVDPEVASEVLGRKIWILVDANRPWLIREMTAELRAIRHDPTRQAASIPSRARKSRKVSGGG